MKPHIYAIGILMFLLAGCAKEEPATPQNELFDVQLNISSVPTRAGESEPTTLERYIIEVYQHENTKLRLDRIVSSTGIIKMRLPKGCYDFYFWVDMGSEYYNAENLNDVKIVENYTPSVNRVCFAGEKLEQTVAENFPTIAVMLPRPVARLNYINTGAAPSTEKSILLAYKDVMTTYNVLTKTSSIPQQTLTVTAEYDPSIIEPEPFVVDYVFPAPQSDRISMDMTFEGGNTKQMSGIQIKANNQTNIKANFN